MIDAPAQASSRVVGDAGGVADFGAVPVRGAAFVRSSETIFRDEPS
jgi:hypothetical protein